MKPLDPIAYDYSGLIAPKDAPPCVKQTGLVEADLRWLAPRLLAARQEELAEAMKQRQAIATVQDKFDHIAAADQDRRDTKEQDDQHASHSARKQA